MEYHTVSSQHLEFFDRECAKMLNAGWTPQGGIAVYRTSMNPAFYHQAFVRGTYDAALRGFIGHTSQPQSNANVDGE